MVEFLLAAPFLIIILGIVTEYAYALNVNMTLSLGLKTVTSEIYKQITPTSTPVSIKNTVYSELLKYLQDNNIPTFYAGLGENALDVKTLTNGDITIFVASYRYYPAFTLPNVYFRILPDKFDFLASAVVPQAFLNDNSSSFNIDTATLTGLYGGSNSTLGDKHGILKDSANSDKMLFFVDAIGYPVSGYLIVDWAGNVQKMGSNPIIWQTGTSNLYSCSVSSCLPCGNLSNVVPSTAPYNVIFVHDTSSDWLSPAGATDLSLPGVSGALKRSVALVDNDDSSVGNYDNAQESSIANSYTTLANDSTVVAYSPTRDQSSIDVLWGILNSN